MLFVAAFTFGQRGPFAASVDDGNSAGGSGTGICNDGFENIPTPAGGFPVTSNMGYRDTGIQGASKWHKGTDYATGCGTRIAGPPPGCQKLGGDATGTRGGYGHVATFDCGNNNAGQKIMIQYAHLQGANSYNANSNTITTGNSGVGGCHLDYIMTVGGKTVDAQCATGVVTSTYSYGNSSRKSGPLCPQSGQVNICDSAFGEQLRQHSDEKFSGSGGRNGYDIANGSTTGGGGGGGADSGNSVGDGFDAGDPVSVFQGTQNLPGGNAPITPRGPIEELGPGVNVLPEPDIGPEEEFNPAMLQPRCESSTCISQDHIDNAKHVNVADDKMQSYHDQILPPKDGNCAAPKETGVTAYRQVVGRFEKNPDAFCLNQGCVKVGQECQ